MIAAWQFSLFGFGRFPDAVPIHVNDRAQARLMPANDAAGPEPRPAPDARPKTRWHPLGPALALVPGPSTTD